MSGLRWWSRFPRMLTALEPSAHGEAVIDVCTVSPELAAFSRIKDGRRYCPAGDYARLEPPSTLEQLETPMTFTHRLTPEDRVHLLHAETGDL